MKKQLKQLGNRLFDLAATKAGYERLPKPAYDADGLRTVHNCDFLRDPLFREAYRLGASTPHRFGSDLHVEWRVHIACAAARQGVQLGGDFVECGVNTGILSRAIMHYVDFANLAPRRFFLLDTYKGIATAMLSADERAAGLDAYNQRLYVDCYEETKRTFSLFPNAVLIQGTVPQTLPQVKSSRVCYLSIDMNAAEPELAAGEYFWERLAPGATVVLDDYGFGGHEAQKAGWDAFAARRGVAVFCLPTGQGLLIKPSAPP